MMLTLVSERNSSAMRLQRYFGDRFRLLALESYSGKGIQVVERTCASEAAERTSALMETAGVNFVANAHFFTNSTHARCDLLQRVITDNNCKVGDSGEMEWDIAMIRPARAGNQGKAAQNLALVRAVAESSGHRIRNAFVLAPWEDYKRGTDAEASLLCQIDITAAVEDELAHMQARIDQVDRMTGLENAPKPSPSTHCSKCELFSECMGRESKGSVWDLPRISNSKLALLLKQGSSIAEVRSESLTDLQRRHWEAVQKGNFVIDFEALRRELEMSQGPPFYYLDFEYMNTAIPIFDGASPFQPTIFQFSLHRSDVFPPPKAPEQKLSIPENGLSHAEYLSDGSKDSLETLCKRLVESIGKEGSVFVYSASEASQLRHLQQQYPHLKDELENIKSRLFDLERTVRGCIAHPDFRGRSSLKNVLPVLAPRYENKYRELAVGDGADAILAFVRMLKPTTNPLEREALKQALLEYCGMDTLALVELHRCFSNLLVGGHSSTEFEIR